MLKIFFQFVCFKFFSIFIHSDILKISKDYNLYEYNSLQLSYSDGRNGKI